MEEVYGKRIFSLYIAIGIFFWFVAALFIRYAGHEVFHLKSLWLILLFIATVPIGWLFIIFSLKLARINTKNTLIPVVVMSITGLLLDGIAISQFPSLYGNNHEHIMLGGAWLLWGVGSLIMTALVMQIGTYKKRSNKRRK